MDISTFGEVNDHIEERLTEIGIKYVYRYYPAKDEFDKNATEVNEILEFAYGKMVDLVKILAEDQTQIQKIRAYRQEIEAGNKYVNYDLAEVYTHLDNINTLLTN